MNLVIIVLDWTNPLAILEFCLCGIFAALSFYYMIFAFRRYLQNPSKARRMLLGIFVTWFGIGFLYVMGYLIPFEVIQYVFALVVILLGIVNIVMLYFGREIFGANEAQQSTLAKLIFSVVQMLVVSVASFFSWVNGVKDHIVAMMMLLHFLLSFISNGYLAINAYRLAHRIKMNQTTAQYQGSVQTIGHFSLLLLVVYILLAISSAQAETYTIWGRLIWPLVIIATTLAYLSFIRPSRRLQAEQKKE